MNDIILPNKIYIKAFFGNFREATIDKAHSFIKNFLYRCPHKPNEDSINSKNLKGVTVKELLSEEEYSKLQYIWKRQDEFHRKWLQQRNCSSIAKAL